MASIKKSLVYSFILSLSQVLIPLVSIPYIARVLDPAGVGRVGFIDSFTYYFITIAEFGIVVYGTREVARLRKNRPALEKLIAELVVLHLLSSACAIILYSIAVFFLWTRIGDTRLVLFSASFLLVNAFACEWYFLGTERFKYITMRSLITRFLGLASIFVLIKAPPDYYIYYGIIVVSACCNGLWNSLVLFRKFPLRIRNINWKKHVPYARVTYGISLLYSVSILLDNVFLRIFSTVTAVAFYSFAMKIARISGLLLSDSLLVFFPRIVALLRDEKTDQLQAVMLKSIEMIIFLAVPLCLGLFLLSNELVAFYLGAAFAQVAEDLRIVTIFPLLKIVSLFISKQVLISHNRENLYLRNLAAGCVIFCVAMPVLCYYYADRGACYGILLTEFVILCLNYYCATKLVTRMQIFNFTGLLQAAISALVFLPAVYLIRLFVSGPFLILLWSAVTCTVAYTVTQVFLFRNSFALYLKKTIVQVIFTSKDSR